VRKHGEFVVATDARRSEVYWARYNREGRRTAGPFVNRQSEITDGSGELPWIGEATGALAHAASVGALATVLLAQGEVLGDRVGALSAHGTDDGATSRQLAGQRLLAPYPLYVRRPDAVEPRPSLLQSQGNP
jgi:tRNA A37 threonylcarbamoyladenosine modification protein TsaB